MLQRFQKCSAFSDGSDGGFFQFFLEIGFDFALYFDTEVSFSFPWLWSWLLSFLALTLILK